MATTMALRAALLSTLFAAPAQVVAEPDRTAPAAEYADVTTLLAGDSAAIAEVTRGRFARPTALLRYRGRFELRALRKGVVVEHVQFDFPLGAELDSDDFTVEARKLQEQLRKNLTARTRVRLPLPPGADAIAIYDARSRRTITFVLKAAPAGAASTAPPAR